MYRQVRGIDGIVSTEMLLRVIDKASIPCTEENKDYREYLEWEAIEGNDILSPEA
jgi:hypothetical protein